MFNLQRLKIESLYFIPHDEKTKLNSAAKIRGKPPIRKELVVVISKVKTAQLKTFLASLQENVYCRAIYSESHTVEELLEPSQ